MVVGQALRLPEQAKRRPAIRGKRTGDWYRERRRRVFTWQAWGSAPGSYVIFSRKRSKRDSFNRSVLCSVALSRPVSARGKKLQLYPRAPPQAGVSVRRWRYSPTENAEGPFYSFADRSRSAFAITETELKLIAAPAIIGLRRTPKNG